MTLHRSYFSKQATLINNNPTNNSRNPIIELSFGGGDSAASVQTSRYIFDIDLSQLKDKIEKEEVQVNQIKSHKIKIKNVINLAEDLIGKDFIEAKRAGGVDVILFALPEGFEEGTGYDFLFYNNFSRAISPELTAPNWEYRMNGQKWLVNGAYSGTPQILASQRLELGNEDLEFDITFFMNCVLNESVAFNGFGIAYVSSVEAIKNEKRHVLTFFSKYTQTFFEPFLETIYGEAINENRNKFYLDEANQLYLSTNKDIDFVHHVHIYDHNDNLYKEIVANDINKIRKNLYRIDLTIQSDEFPDLINFRDVWYYSYRGKIREHVQEFTLAERDLFDDKSSLAGKEFWFSFSGIRQNDVISNSTGKKLVTVNTKKLYNSSITTQPDIDGLEFRIFTTQGKNQIEVIPFTSVDKINAIYSFMIDFTWFVPHHYNLEMRITHNGIEYKNNQIIKFRVVQ